MGVGDRRSDSSSSVNGKVEGYTDGEEGVSEARRQLGNGMYAGDKGTGDKRLMVVGPVA